MLGKYTKEGGRLPELNCLPSVQQPGTPRVYFPNSPWLSGLQASADARRGQARDISSAASFPRPTGTPQATRRVLSADVRAGGDGGSEWPSHALSGSIRVTWFSHWWLSRSENTGLSFVAPVTVDPQGTAKVGLCLGYLLRICYLRLYYYFPLASLLSFKFCFFL